ncbi:MAG TPA: Cof-type HAD-IIB family hydrolase [Chondromyces sp.]|nr:Cof-type HAD-IIB family hydrolase [Chondromyces sp.]
MVYRLLALNIDGTLLQENGRLNKDVKEAIGYAQKKGIYISLVSSRHYPSVKKAAKALKIDSYLVSHQGAYIASQLDKPVFVQRINEDITYELVQFLQSFDCRINLSHEKFSVSNKKDIPDSLLGRTVWQRTNRFFYAQHYVDSLTDYLDKEMISPPKIDIRFDTVKDMEDAVKAMKAMYDEVDIIQTDKLTIDIVPRGISKWAGLMYLTERLHVKREEIVMIGSGIDDIVLIENAGVGVAMGNADEEVKRRADWVTRSVTDNGVSYVVKELFRRQQPIRFMQKSKISK